MNRITVGICLGLMVGFAASSARADTISYSDSISLQSTNWTKSLTFDKFDTTLGTLNSITFTLDGYVLGTGKAENMDATDADITLDLEAMLKLKRPSGTLIVESLPLFESIDHVAAFDGVADFLGADTIIHSGVSASDSEAVTLISSSDKALFSIAGSGTIALPVTASGISSASGPGNVSEQFGTQASANVSVVYDYTPLPEPMTLSLLALGSLALIRRRKR